MTMTKNKKNKKTGNPQKKCMIVFSGFNQRAVIAFLRTLKRNNVEYAIIAKSEDDTIFLTRYKKDVLAIRQSVSLDLEDMLSMIKITQNKHIAGKYVIAPTSEALNRFLIAHRESFERNRCEIPLVSKDLYDLISDKYTFGELCSKNGILIPREIKFGEIESFPVVAKPKKYFSSDTKEALSPVIISESSDLVSFCGEHNVNDYYFQEYIGGRSLYLLYFFSKNRSPYKYSQENIIQQPNGKSMVAVRSSDFHNSAESEKYERLFARINFFGLVMVEVKQKNNLNYMIEANPRFWGPSQLFVDANVNFFEAFLYDWELLENPPEFHEPSDVVRYFWFGGLIDAYCKKELLTYHEGNEDALMCSLPLWLQSDVYRRTDTIDLFKKEIFK